MLCFKIWCLTDKGRQSSFGDFFLYFAVYSILFRNINIWNVDKRKQDQKNICIVYYSIFSKILCVKKKPKYVKFSQKRWTHNWRFACWEAIFINDCNCSLINVWCALYSQICCHFVHFDNITFFFSLSAQKKNSILNTTERWIFFTVWLNTMFFTTSVKCFLFLPFIVKFVFCSKHLLHISIFCF